MRDRTIIPPECLVGKPNNRIPFGYTKLTPEQVKKLFGSRETVLFGFMGYNRIAPKPLTLNGEDPCNYFMLTCDYNHFFFPKKATVDGVEIVLTPEQVAEIEETKKEQEKEQEKNRIKKDEVLVGFHRGNITETFPGLDSNIYNSMNPSFEFWRANDSYDNVADCMKIPVVAHRFSKIRKATPEEITMFENLERERVRD